MEQFWEEERIKYENLTEKNAPKLQPTDAFSRIYKDICEDKKFGQIIEIVWENEPGEAIIAILQSLSLSVQKSLLRSQTGEESQSEDEALICLKYSIEKKYCNPDFMLYLANLKKYFDKEIDNDYSKEKKLQNLRTPLIDSYFAQNNLYIKCIRKKYDRSADISNRSGADEYIDLYRNYESWCLVLSPNFKHPIFISSRNLHIDVDYEANDDVDSRFIPLFIDMKNSLHDLISSLQRIDHPPFDFSNLFIFGIFTTSFLIHIFRIKILKDDKYNYQIEKILEYNIDKELKHIMTCFSAINYYYSETLSEYLSLIPDDIYPEEYDKYWLEPSSHEVSREKKAEEIPPIETKEMVQIGDVLTCTNLRKILVSNNLNLTGCRAKIFVGVDYIDEYEKINNENQPLKNQTKTEYIIKVELKKLRDIEIPNEALNYIRVNDHPNFAKLIGWGFLGNAHYFIVLSKEKNDPVPLHPHHLFPFTIGLLNALVYMHEKQIIHRDVKRGNIAYDATNKHVILLDLDLSYILDDKDYPTIDCGTRGYKAPEIDNVNPYLQPIDVWSFGVTLASMLLKKSFFVMDISAIEIKLLIEIELPALIERKNYPLSIFAELIYKTLEVSPLMRISAKDALHFVQTHYRLYSQTCPP